MSEAARSALFVNLLTEDNLPHYFRTISERFGRDDAWGTWTRRWTAEEGRHAIVIRDYVTVTRAIDPVALERARMTQVSDGVVPEPPSLADALVYTSLQELATRIAHHNTGRLLSDSAGRQIMTRVAADENLHHLFYRDLTTAALEIDPATVVPAIDRQVRHFAMPGTGIPDFARHARAIAKAGVYDFAAHHDQILVPVLLRHWRVDRLQGLKATAEQARERLLGHIDRVGRIARRLVERREPRAAT
jgi:acyl-[acyl-carrier-protein] desaturase